MPVTPQSEDVARPFCWCDPHSGDSCTCLITPSGHIAFVRSAPSNKGVLEGCIEIAEFVGIRISGTRSLRIELVCAIATKVHPTVQHILLGECDQSLRSTILELAAGFEESVRAYMSLCA